MNFLKLLVPFFLEVKFAAYLLDYFGLGFW